MMDRHMLIRDIFAREILDSRGNPTIEAEVLAGENIVGTAGRNGALRRERSRTGGRKCKQLSCSYSDRYECV